MTDISREAVEALAKTADECELSLEDPVGSTLRALRAEVDALEAKLAERVTVKPLEFKKDGPDCIIAGDYSICHETHGYQIYRGAVVLGKEHTTRAMAEAKVQADHKSRTSAAITTAPITPAEAVRIMRCPEPFEHLLYCLQATGAEVASGQLDDALKASLRAIAQEGQP